METKLRVDILPQPDDNSCGPTCLHALYRYYGDELPLDQVLAEVPMLESGGTLDVLLANHASHLDALILAAPLPLGIRDHVFSLAAGDVFFEKALTAAFATTMSTWPKSFTARSNNP